MTERSGPPNGIPKAPRRPGSGEHFDLDDKHALAEIAKRFDEIRQAGGNGSVAAHLQNGKVQVLKTDKTEVLQISK